MNSNGERYNSTDRTNITEQKETNNLIRTPKIQGFLYWKFPYSLHDLWSQESSSKVIPSSSHIILVNISDRETKISYYLFGYRYSPYP